MRDIEIFGEWCNGCGYETLYTLDDIVDGCITCRCCGRALYACTVCVVFNGVGACNTHCRDSLMRAVRNARGAQREIRALKGA